MGNNIGTANCQVKCNICQYKRKITLKPNNYMHVRVYDIYDGLVSDFYCPITKIDDICDKCKNLSREKQNKTSLINSNKISELETIRRNVLNTTLLCSGYIY